MPPWNDEHELDPVADAEPVDDARSPAEQEAPRQGAARAPARPAAAPARPAPATTQVEPRERRGSAAPPRPAPAASSARRPSRFLAHQVRHVGTAHQRTAEHHLEADARARSRDTRRTARGSMYAATGRLRRVGCRYCPMVATSVPAARRSRSSARTSSSVSPSPTMKPDFVSTSAARSAAQTRSTSSDCR